MNKLKESIDFKKNDMEKLPLPILLAKSISTSESDKKESRIGTNEFHNDPSYNYFSFGKPISKML